VRWITRSGEVNTELLRSRLRRAGVVVLCAKLFLVPLVLDPGSLVAFALPKALLSHALAYLLLGVLAALFLRFGRRFWVGSPLHLAVAFYASVYLAATAFALDHTVALFGAPDRALGLVSVLDNVILFFALVLLIRTKAEAIAAISAVLAAGIAVVAYALIQRLSLDPLPWASGYAPTRPFSTMGNPGVLGQYLGTLGAGLLAVALIPPLALSRGVRAALLAVSLVVFAGSFLSGTRAIVFGVAAAGLTLGVVAFLRANRRRDRLLVASTLALGVLAALAGATLTPLGRELARALLPVEGAFDESRPIEGSIAGRLVHYEVAISEVAARPLLGVGPDNYSVAFPRFRPEGAAAALPTEVPETSPHSWIAHLATDAGFLGLLAYAGILVTGLALLARQGFPPLGTSGSVAMASFLGTGLFSVNDVGTEWLPWAALALVARATSDRSEPPKSESRDKRRKNKQTRAPRHQIGIAVCLLIGAILAVSPIPAWQAAQAAEASRRARLRGQPALAVPISERAVGLDPRRAEYWHGLGLALAGADRFDRAVNAFTRAVEIAPYHVTYLGNLARAFVTLGLKGDDVARRRALEIGQRAVAADPNNSEAHFTLALAALTARKPEEAAAASERGIALKPVPRDKSVYEIAGRAYLDLKKPADAERWLLLSLQHRSGRDAHPSLILLARALTGLGRRDEALRSLDVVLSEDPTNAAALELRREIRNSH
jgi:tetratricopeptide (TPR) repeat protein